ncbi:MAG TPA: RES family NAD+ phosphorylase [Acidobacteriaceae bacterium]
MDLWRIDKYASLDGEGGRLYSARWHTAVSPIVYLAASPPGALIEVLVHLEIKELTAPPSYTLLRISVPDKLQIRSLNRPKGEAWKDDVTFTRKLGDAWLKSQSSALARVPSAILPNTFNYLLNPLHKDARRIRIAESLRATFDPRLIR